ncbi:MAG: sialidase family protein, partial [Spirochaetaceae bacterium]|nr:sialidase family protein [Spirochaetaceae bacterium]
PRLSRLGDGRLVILCDRDDDGHFHPDQPPANLAWWSGDDGRTWGPAEETGIMGFEPDRMLELGTGQLAVLTHIMRPDSQEFAEILSLSDDGGRTWREAAEVAHDGYHRFCEGALVFLDGGPDGGAGAGGELACVMRENHSAGIPSFVAFSSDHGETWTPPQMCPFALHRPYAKRLADGRVLVTGRHVNGGLGTYAWCGDLRAEAGTYQVGGPRRKFAAELTGDALRIDNRPGYECLYSLLPPEGARSEILFEAEVKVAGSEPAAFLSISRLRSNRGSVVLSLAGDHLSLADRRPAAVDFSRFRTVQISHRRGLLQVRVDGEVVRSASVFHEELVLSEFMRGGPLYARTMFGQLGEAGTSWWRRVRYETRNRRLTDWRWNWAAADGVWPDQYQRDRLTQVHGNHPDQKPGPDHGYSSWLQQEDGTIVFVDYTNLGDEGGKSHLIGALINPRDLA